MKRRKVTRRRRNKRYEKLVRKFKRIPTVMNPWALAHKVTHS